ncbi:hypothetical protein BDV96DRAFT_683574 [Lophiotrema nucula]|uniref:Uncharacterized protein n=1 Tax=Lophiotrema nucula TaxID=690887 RepID=A0A6A5ZP76_9PLEO|nr:hypothetical protein BDV96DRAFT_683574 [Lophiotrema nucula]
MARLFVVVMAAITMPAATLAAAPPNSNQRCGIANGLVNATDYTIFEDPFKTPDGLFANGSGTWNWTLATQTSTRDSANISQVLHLSIDPQPDFFDQDVYVGCGVIIHGLAYDRQVAGQASASGGCEPSKECTDQSEPRNGCKNALLDSCSKRLGDLAQRAALEYGFWTGVQTTPSDACIALEQLDLKSVVDCKDHFNANVWLEPFLWAGASLNQSSCSFEPGSSNASDTAVYSWGHSEYSSSNLKVYNNLTTLIEPIITVLSSPHEANADARWATANTMCLRTGRNIADGSQPAPSEVPRASSSKRLLAPKSAQIVLVASVMLLLGSFVGRT